MSFTRMLCPVVPLCLHPAQLIPQGTWVPFPCHGELSGKTTACRANLPACAALLGLPFLSRRMAAGPGHSRRMLRAMEGAGETWPDP